MKIILLGVQGCGKGTQATRINEKYGIPKIGTGEILRAEIAKGSDLGKEAQTFMDKGILVPDSIMVNMVANRLKEDDCKKGFILDGFPRTMNQAVELDKLVKVDSVIYFDIDVNIVLERIAMRQTCPQCGEPYMPEITLCPKCNVPTIKRVDDANAAAVNKRIQSFMEQTLPLMDYYKEKGVLRKIDSSGLLEQTSANMDATLKECFYVKG